MYNVFIYIAKFVTLFLKIWAGKTAAKIFFWHSNLCKKNTIFVCFNWITTQIFPIFRFQLAIERKEDIQFHLVIRINEK